MVTVFFDDIVRILGRFIAMQMFKNTKTACRCLSGQNRIKQT